MKKIKCKRLGSLGWGLLIGLMGSLISLLPVTSGWEEGAGLGLLFHLRGQRSAPEEVVIVTINGETGAQLGLGEEIPEWPRSIHAELIERLREAGVALIAIDIFFKKPGDEERDARLAKAIKQAGNVLLVGYLERQRIRTGAQSLYVERLIPPAAPLVDSAVGIAPFVLPKVPVRVSRFWTFNGENALPSLPVRAVYQLADPTGDTLARLLKLDPAKWSGNHNRLHMAQRLRSEPALRERLRERLLSRDLNPPLDPVQRARLQALLNIYDGEVYPYLNFYGPPASLTTIPYQQLLKADAQLLQSLRGKVIFIGYAGSYQPKQRDGFYTVFSQENGLDLSGVEIAATAFTNLLKGESLSRLSPLNILLLCMAYGLAITLLLRSLPGSLGILITLLTGMVYLSVAYALFDIYQIWLPWFVPLGLQTPLAMIIVLTRHYRQMHLSREQLRDLFGYYLPGDVIDRLALDRERTMGHGDKAFGICLASDARQYTRLAEQMEPDVLKTFLNRYYEVLFAPVRSRGGVVSDVIGDAMLAIWPSTSPDVELRQKACEAALDIVNNLQTSDLEPSLPTGIGLHAGELVMSHVGAIDHFEYRAVGDMVNTTSRIEVMNKLLGTTILASEEMLPGLRGIVTRKLGAFLVTGRQQPIELYEIAALEADATAALRELHRAFAEALDEWRAGERSSAHARFEAILERYPKDGPSAYYVQQYRERRRSQINPLTMGKLD
ncbi:MAG: adenylate/guanylate cyclase domain-containing protein [Candidatus Thiodiazotropha sp.]